MNSASDYTILIVDDQTSNLEVLSALLESRGFEVLAARDGEAAIAIAQHAQPKLILLDVILPKMDGFEVCRRLKADKLTEHIPVIFMTILEKIEDKVQGFQVGAVDYITKPFQTEEVLARVTTQLRLRSLTRELQEANETLERRVEERTAQLVEMNEALRSSEERLRAFANALPDLAFIMDENGRYLQLLNAPEHLLYSATEERIGKCVHDVLPESVAEQIIDTIHRTVKSGATQSVEYQLELPAGLTWFEGRTSLMTGVSESGMQLVVYVARDITDGKEAELNLRRERNQLRTLIDNIPDYIFVQNDQGQFVASNTAHAAMAELTPSQIIGKQAVDVFAPTLAQQFHVDDASVMRSCQALINEERLINVSPVRQQWVLMTKVPIYNDEAEVIGLVGIARDITSRKYMEGALRESEAYLRAVISGTPVILFVIDKDGVLTLFQGHGLDRLTVDPKTYLGKSIFDLLVDIVPDIRERFQRMLLGEETASVQTIEDMIFDVRYSPMYDTLGEVSGIVGVATDITERLRAERLQLALEKEQEVINLKERFISTASHDFRTPLSLIKLLAKMLDTYDDRITPEQRIAKLRQISTQVDRMTRLIDDVLTMSKANSGKLEFSPEEVELKPFCQDIWDNFQPMAGKTHRMDFVYNCGEDVAFLDPNLVHYLLANLLSNAIKYSPVDGHVRFEVLCDDDDLIFRVSDNGIGIPLQDQPKLFEPFHRATNTGGIDGTGLGLSIVKSYVDVHHGHIEVESKENQGTTFTISIPIESSVS